MINLTVYEHLGKIASSSNQFELSKNKSFPNKWISLRVVLENQGDAVETVYLDFSTLSDGVSQDMFSDKDELTFKDLCVQST